MQRRRALARPYPEIHRIRLLAFIAQNPHLPDTSALYLPGTDPDEHDTHLASASLEVLSGRIPGTGSVLAGRPLPLP
jgi:hypothetical protein